MEHSFSRQTSIIKVTLTLPRAQAPVEAGAMRCAESNYGDYVKEMKASFKWLHDTAKANLILSKQKRKEIYDENTNEWQPMWGDLVLVKSIPTGAGQKLQSLWRGPYEVVDLPSEQTTVIKKWKEARKKIHNNRLKKI